MNGVLFAGYVISPIALHIITAITPLRHSAIALEQLLTNNSPNLDGLVLKVTTTKQGKTIWAEGDRVNCV